MGDLSARSPGVLGARTHARSHLFLIRAGAKFPQNQGNQQQAMKKHRTLGHSMLQTRSMFSQMRCLFAEPVEDRKFRTCRSRSTPAVTCLFLSWFPYRCRGQRRDGVYSETKRSQQRESGRPRRKLARIPSRRPVTETVTETVTEIVTVFAAVFVVVFVRFFVAVFANRTREKIVSIERTPEARHSLR